MDILDVKKGVVDLWQFAWPPIIFLLLATSILRKWFPDQWEWLTAYFNRNVGDDHKKNRLRNFLNSIGASKVYPVALFVLCVLLLQVINELLVFCSSFPPHLAFQPWNLTERITSKDDMAKLQAVYPDAYDFERAYGEALSNLEEPRRLNNRAEFYVQIQNLATTTAYGTGLLFFLSLRHPKSRAFLGTFIVILLSAVVWLVCVIPIVREQEQEIYRSHHKIMAEVHRVVRERSIDINDDRVTKNLHNFIPGGDWQPWWNIVWARGNEWVWFRREILSRGGQSD